MVKERIYPEFVSYFRHFAEALLIKFTAVDPTVEVPVNVGAASAVKVPLQLFSKGVERRLLLFVQRRSHTAQKGAAAL